MRVVFYTRPHFLDAALPFAAELARRVELHFILEVAPESRRSSLLDIAEPPVAPGLIPAEAVLSNRFPPTVREHWQDCASFQVVVHHERRSLHPSTWRTSASVGRLLDRLQPDIVHLDEVTLRGLGMVPALRRHPTLVAVHDPLPHRGEGSWRNRLARRVTYTAARGFVLHNEAQRPMFARLQHVPLERVGVVHLGPYTVYRAWSERRSRSVRPTVLFFGRVSPYKGLEVLYAAAPRVAEQVPGVRFVVAGRTIVGYTPPPPPRLPAEATLEVMDSYIPNAQLVSLIETAHVVVCPYTEATQSGVVLTAYGLETPVVASRVGGLPEYVRDGDSGLLVPPGDPAALAAALIRVLREPGLLAHLQEGVRSLVAGDLAWAGAVDRLTDIYQGLHASPGSSNRRGEGK